MACLQGDSFVPPSYTSSGNTCQQADVFMVPEIVDPSTYDPKACDVNWNIFSEEECGQYFILGIYDRYSNFISPKYPSGANIVNQYRIEIIVANQCCNDGNQHWAWDNFSGIPEGLNINPHTGAITLDLVPGLFKILFKISYTLSTTGEVSSFGFGKCFLSDCGIECFVTNEMAKLYGLGKLDDAAELMAYWSSLTAKRDCEDCCNQCDELNAIIEKRKYSSTKC